MSSTVKVLTVKNRDHCIGCFSCMYGCSRMLRSHGGIEKAALRVQPYTGVEGAFSLRVCVRCENPECAASCPNKALAPAPGGGVRLKKDACLHCNKCVRGCKLSVLQWDSAEKTPLPCVHCGQCAKYCPNKVIAMDERQTEPARQADV